MHTDLTRREAIQAVAAVGLAAVTGRAAGQGPSTQPSSRPSEPYYYVDGYHGGVDGHMPQSSLRNVLDGLDRDPRWKVSFEIEPYSWAVFAKTDPASIERLRKFLDDQTPAGRIELVSGAYGQTYAWNINGESNIRQLMYGIEEIRAVFPKVVVDTYAVQEPCWTSCLPQLLKSLGYRRAVLKNSTCWGGYHATTVDADLMTWIGPDGSSIATVPRYACEKLIGPATEENAQPTADFVERCKAAGIAHPAGTILQDMGWPGRPWRLGMTQQIVQSLKHVTWRQYVDTIASPASKDWHASQEDMRGALAWGATILQRIAQIVRASENQILQAEKLASMAGVRAGFVFPASDLKQVWKYLLRSQHHDVWIVPYNRRPGGTWASEADQRRTSIDQTCRQIIQNAVASMAGESQEPRSKATAVRIFNTTGFRRREPVVIQVPRDAAAGRFEVRDAQGKALPSQIAAGGGADAPAEMLVLADVPAMGFTTCEIASVSDQAPAPNTNVYVRNKPDGSIVLETDLYTIAIDPKMGGTISSLVAKDLKREFVDRSSARALGEFRGYFSVEGKWLSSADAPATVTIVEQGPLRAVARIAGRIGDYPFETNLSVAAGQRRLDLRTTFQFPVDGLPFSRNNAAKRLRIGEPWERGRDATRSNRRPFYDSSYKLQALFPVALEGPKLFKNAAFDVCQSRLENTTFSTWDTIKHNVIVNWVDLLAADRSAGVALMSDHTTAYSFGGGEPLGLVMCYAGVGNWFDYTLGRVPTVSYALLPHAGDWAEARLWRELARWSEPMIAHTDSNPLPGAANWSLLDVTGSGLQATTVYKQDGHVLIRLFNAEGNDSPQRLELAEEIQKLEMVELNGRLIGEVPVAVEASGSKTATIAMPRFGVRTLRITVADGKK